MIMNFFQNVGLSFNKNNKKYIIQEIQKANNVSYIKELIEKANPDIIDYEILDIAVKKGYHINDNTPIPKNSINYLHDYIQNITNLEYLKFVVENHLSYIGFNDFYLAMQKGYKPSKEAIIKFLETKEKFFSFVYGMTDPWYDKSKIYGDLPLILSHLDENNISFEALRIATRFGYKEFENTPVLKFNTFEEIKKFFEEYDSIPYEKVQSLARSSKDGFLLKNECDGQHVIVGKIIADNLDIMTYELLDSIRSKGLNWPASLAGKINIKINSKEEMKETLRNMQAPGVIWIMINNSTRDVMDAEIFRESINKGYRFQYNTPQYIFEEEQYKEFVSKEKEKLYKDNDLKYIDYISPYLMDSKIFKKACRNGYEIEEKTPEYIKNNMDYVACYILTNSSEYGQNESLKKYVNLSPEQQDELMFNLIEHNYRINSRTPEIYQKFKYIKEALKKDISHMSYGDTQFIYNSLNDNEKKEVESIILDAMDNIKIVNRIPKSLINFSFIKKLTEKGWMDVMSYPDDYLYIFSEEQQDELILTAIEQGYRILNFFSGYSKIPIKLQYIEKGFECKQFSVFQWPYFNEYIKSLSPNDQERLLFKLIDSGYDYYQMFFLQEPKYKIRFIRNGHIDTVWLNINNLNSEEKKQLNEAISIAIQKGYNFSSSTPNWMRSYEFIKMAIERENDPQPEAIMYLVSGSKTPLNEEEKKLCKMAVQKGYSFNYDTPEWMRSFELIEYAITQEKKPQLNAIEYLNFDNVPEDKKEEVSKWLNEYVLKYDIWDVMINIINEIKDSDYINSFSQEQLKCFKYLLQYPDLISIYSKEKIDNFYEHSIKNKGLCKELFENKRWSLLFELISDNDTLCSELPEIYKYAISKGNDIQNYRMRQTFMDYIVDNKNNLNQSQVDSLIILIERIEYSNSLELRSMGVSVLDQLLPQEDPVTAFNKLEDVFLKNNLPLMGKVFLSFKILYPNFSKIQNNQELFNVNDDSRIALQYITSNLPKVGYHENEVETKFRILFNDILRISCKTGERSLIEYIDNIEQGYDIYQKITSNQEKIELLDWNVNQFLTKEETEVLDVFVSHLKVLYDHMKNKEEIDFDNLSLMGQIDVLNKIFNTSSKYNLKDRIIRSFCYYAGVNSLDELKKFIQDEKQETITRLKRNAELVADSPFKIEVGDCFRGIGDIAAFSGSIKTGNYCKELLTTVRGTSDSDTTPLDVDITLNLKETDIYHCIENTPTGFGFGNVYLIMKKDNPNFVVTRDKDGNIINQPYNPKKAELFGTNTASGGYETHWGARTGISIYDCDYILYKENRIIDAANPYDENGNVNYAESKKELAYDDLLAIKYEIAKRGIYMPIIDFSGKLIFTQDEFDKLREQMQGLSYFGVNEYKISDNIVTPETQKIVDGLDESIRVTIEEEQNIWKKIKPAFDNLGLKMLFDISTDLTPGTVELVNTGSTGRATNELGKGDFDYILRIDQDYMMNPNKHGMLVEEIKKCLGGKCVVTDIGDLRFTDVKLDDGTIVEVDVSIVVKTNKVTYSSDMCLRDRLSTIEKKDKEKIKYVVANVILAKHILKAAEVYKSRKAATPQGGLGGIGIENWVLQNGGSFYDAAKSFIDAAEGKSYEEFRQIYSVWDFGENHFSVRKNKYEYDNFVSDNMTPQGYRNMVEVLKKYIYAYEHQQEEDFVRNLVKGGQTVNSSGEDTFEGTLKTI